MLRLSIIIPMYNVEKYIEKCLYSCLKQDISFGDYEIIVVNDGTPDNSLEIANRIANTYSNINIVSQENKGLSEARNTGFRYARGKYVWFVDSDDTIKENCLSNVLEQCENQELDLLAICAADVINGKTIRRFSYSCKNVIKGSEVLNRNWMICCVPFTIYRKDFLVENNLRFYPGIYYEDSEFTPRSYFMADRVGFTNDILYFYLMNPESITNSINPKRAFDRIKIALSLDSFYSSKVVSTECDNFYHNYISQVINNGMNYFYNLPNRSEAYEDIEKFTMELYNNRNLLLHFRKSSILKYKIEGYLFTIFPKFSFAIFTIFKKIFGK